MRRRFRALTIGAAVAIGSCVFAETTASGSRIPSRDILKQVRPEYSIEARRHHLIGSGVLILHIDRPTGRVTSVTVQKSTGHKILDDAGIRAFSQWRFRPGAVKTEKIWMPISFNT